MQIYVCVKHVPDSAASITIIDDTGIDQNISFLLNPFDEHAITEAVKIREMQIKKMDSDTQVIAICLGLENAHATLQSALAMGADRGILVKTNEHHDSIFTAKALKAAIDTDLKLGLNQNLDKTPDLILPDLILTGKESIDAEGMQTMFRVGALFDFPVVNNIVKLEIENDQAIVDQELSDGVINSYAISLPCVIGAGKRLNTPKYPTFPDVVKARKKKIKKIELADLDIKAPHSSMTIVKLEPLLQKRNPEEIKGTAVEAAEQIIQILKQKAKVIS